MNQISATESIDRLHQQTTAIREGNRHIVGTSLGSDFANVERAGQYLKHALNEIAAIRRRNPYSETASQCEQFDMQMVDTVSEFLSGGIVAELMRRVDMETRRAA